ncbi:MAG: flavodoxin domain-containing protein [archaeon]
MKSVIILKSTHKGNTKKIALEINKVLKGKIVDAGKAKENDLQGIDLIGFGSGIYFGKHHKELFNFIKNLKPVNNLKAFVFSTSGNGKIENHKKLNELLKEKDFKIVKEWSCKGFESFGPFKSNQGKPDEKDFKKAKEFALSLK